MAGWEAIVNYGFLTFFIHTNFNEIQFYFSFYIEAYGGIGRYCITSLFTMLPKMLVVNKHVKFGFIANYFDFMLLVLSINLMCLLWISTLNGISIYCIKILFHILF